MATVSPTPTTLPESLRRNMHNQMPRLPAIRTTPADSRAYSPGPLGATPHVLPRSLPSLTPAAYPTAYPQSESPPFMNPIAASHAIARNRHMQKAEKGGVSGWYHRKMAARENKKFKKMYV